MPDELSEYIEDLGKVNVVKGTAVRFHVTYLIRYDTATRCVYALQVYPETLNAKRLYLYRGCSLTTARRITIALEYFIKGVL